MSLHIEEVRRSRKPVALIYARCSGNESKSVSEQISMCRARVEERGWTAKYLLKDEGASGGFQDRPGFQALLHHVYEEHVDVIVAWKMDRLARSLRDIVNLQFVLDQNGIGLHSCTEQIDTTTPHGKFVFTILAGAGELERDLTKTRIKEIMDERAKKGIWTQGRTPYGYERQKNGSLRIHRHEAEVIRRIFQSYSRLKSRPEVAAHLNYQGIHRRGKPWTASTIRSVLQNQMLTGWFIHRGTKTRDPTLKIMKKSSLRRAREISAKRIRRGKPSSKTLQKQARDNVMRQYLATLEELPGS